MPPRVIGGPVGSGSQTHQIIFRATVAYFSEELEKPDPYRSNFVGAGYRADALSLRLAACRTYPARLRNSGIRSEFPLVFVICVHANSSNS